jgi:hypothetical protein
MNILRTCPTALFQGLAAAFFKLSSMLLPSLGPRAGPLVLPGIDLALVAPANR